MKWRCFKKRLWIPVPGTGTFVVRASGVSFLTKPWVAQDQNSSKVYDWSSWVCNCQRLWWFQLVSFFPAGKSGNTRSFFPNLACLSSPPCPLFQNANRTNGLFLICKLSVRCMLRLWISHTLPIVWKPLNFLWINFIVFTKCDPSGLGTIEFSKL